LGAAAGDRARHPAHGGLAGGGSSARGFTEEATLKALLDALGGRPVDLVISDMSPNISGVDSADKARAMYLSELALDFAAQVLKPGGAFLMKSVSGVRFQ